MAIKCARCSSKTQVLRTMGAHRLRRCARCSSEFHTVETVVATGSLDVPVAAPPDDADTLDALLESYMEQGNAS